MLSTPSVTRFLVLLATTLAAGIPSQVAIQSTILASEPQSPATIRLMTYNIHHCEGTEGKLDVERIAEIIRAQKCDLVALQEVDQGTKRSDKVNQAFELGKQLGCTQLLGKAIDFGGGEYGVAVLCRWPITSQKTHRLPSDRQREQRVALEISTQLETGQRVTFVCTHLDHTSGTNDRGEQNQALVKLFSASAQPVILAGDFNSTIDAPEIAPVIEHWKDVDSDQLKPTIPVRNPNRKIDYIFLPRSTPWTVVDNTVLDEPLASDHLPLVATVKLETR